MDDAVALADYRRAVSEQYAAVRAAGCSRDSWAVWRDARDALLASHPMTPVAADVRAAFAGAAFAPYDPSWNLLGRVDSSTAVPVRSDVAHSGEGSTGFRRVGDVVVERHGLESRLALWWLEGYSGGLFVPFADATNGITTYGGGRYLLDTAKGADLGVVGDRLVLDFNFAYHPSCAWDPRWSCPLAPADNRLDVPVEAGELVPRG